MPGGPRRPAFGDGRPPRRRSFKALVLAIAASAWVHATILGTAAAWAWMHRPPPAREKPSDVEMIDLNTMPALRAKVEEIRKIARIDEAKARPVVPPTPKSPDGQIVQLPKPATEEKAPENAKYRASDNHNVKEETVAAHQMMAPKVLADSFKGTGDAAGEKSDSTHQGDAKHSGESTGLDAKTERLRKGTRDAVADATAMKPTKTEPIADPFGILRHPEEEVPTPTPGGEVGDSDRSANTRAAGGGTKLAMAGAPANDYLPGVKVGDRTALMAKADFFASFWNRVQNAVGPFWEKHINESVPMGVQKRDYQTRVDVTLDASGNLLAVEVTQSCGIPAWDRAVVTAFSDAAPFLNPPRGLADRDGKIHMNDLGFVVRVGAAQIVHMYADPRAGNLFPGVHEGGGFR